MGLRELVFAEPPQDATEDYPQPCRVFQVAHAGLREQLHNAEARVQRLLQQRKEIPPRVRASDRRMLSTEKKRIADTIEMDAYQVETQPLEMLQDHYARADEEGRTLPQAAFQSSARLEVADRWDSPDRRLRVGMPESLTRRYWWLEKGLIALRLALPNGPGLRSPNYFEQPPPFDYDVQEMRTVAAAVLADEFVCNEMLGLPGRNRIVVVGTFRNTQQLAYLGRCQTVVQRLPSE
ncbi:MAG TPA: hypothetical protein VMY37_12085 [Thermoguttaceae bacterium]|nr:hypothetical protein [Thermoguttaceae bacterium]